MSGIFGIVRGGEEQVAEAELAQMAEELKHRGPDGIRYSARKNVGLGHCMLQSTPESLREILPFRDTASGLTITADARIDNREKLMSELPLQVVSGQVISDSYLILRSYMKWGEACVDHLLGDFAFTIWDENTESLFVARDHMGCKPFYYHCHDGLFVFASSANAVARILGKGATLNEGRVADYLVDELEGINKTCTFFNEISRMPPAHCGHYRQGYFQLRQYWKLEPRRCQPLSTDEEYLEAFTEIYTEAVRARLRCQVDPASMLSGGLDSSTIVALARDLLIDEGKPPLMTLSALSDDPANCRETRSVEAIVAQGNLAPKYWRASEVENHLQDVVPAMGAMEDPFDRESILLAMMYLGAAQNGNRVVLDGLDGHLAMGAPSGYISFLLRDGQWRNGWKEARGLAEHYYLRTQSAAGLYLRALRSRFTPDILRAVKRRLGRRLRYRSLTALRPISEDFGARANLATRMLEYESTLSAGQVGIDEMTCHALQVPYLTVAIERYERVASYFGVDGRHPLLDIRLLQFSVDLPLKYRVRGGWSKFMLRLLANERLPPSVAWRNDWDRLGWNFIERLVQACGRADAFPVIAMKESLSPYMQVWLLERHLSHDSLKGNPESVHIAWSAYCLHQWIGRCASIS